MKLRIKLLLLAVMVLLSVVFTCSCGVLREVIADGADENPDSDISDSDGEAKDDPIDMAELVNNVTSEAMLFNVKIVVQHLIKPGTIYQKTSESVGSGVIYKIEEGYCYIISNDHVVSCSDEGCTKTYNVYDAFGVWYEARLLMCDPTYDLSVLRICMKKNELHAAKFADSTAEIGDKVISLGSPAGQINAITFGEVKDYRKVDATKGGEKLDFDVVFHSCPIKRGSSGGVLMNYDLEIVGINYAGFSGENDLEMSLAIPLDVALRYVNSNLVTKLPEEPEAPEGEASGESASDATQN